MLSLVKALLGFFSGIGKMPPELTSGFQRGGWRDRTGGENSHCRSDWASEEGETINQ